MCWSGDEWLFEFFPILLLGLNLKIFLTIFLISWVNRTFELCLFLEVIFMRISLPRLRQLINFKANRWKINSMFSSLEDFKELKQYKNHFHSGQPLIILIFNHSTSHWLTRKQDSILLNRTYQQSFCINVYNSNQNKEFKYKIVNKLCFYFCCRMFLLMLSDLIQSCTSNCIVTLIINYQLNLLIIELWTLVVETCNVWNFPLISNSISSLNR